MSWIGPAIALAGNMLMGSSGPAGGGASGGGPVYTPTGLGAADSGWQNAFGQQGSLANNAYASAIPAYDRSFQSYGAIDYSPLMEYGQRSGQAYGQVGDVAMGQMGQFGQRAQGDAAAQEGLYGGATSVMATGMDPQRALFDRTQQQLQEQVRAGQAARGLGTSAVGAAEENQAMSNFDIDWQNAQLARQATALQAAGGAVNSGVNAGRMYGADQTAALQAGASGAGYYGQAGMAPISAAEYAAGGPARGADMMIGGYGNVGQMYGNIASGAIPYMYNGQGAQQNNWKANYASNAAMTNGLTQLGTAMAPAIKDWWNGSGSSGPWGAYGTAMNQGSPMYSGGAGYDVPYG